MVNRVKGGGRAPSPSPARADFSIVMELECTPEIGAIATLCVLCERKCEILYGTRTFAWPAAGLVLRIGFLQDL
jgi:hypothetical protein